MSDLDPSSELRASDAERDRVAELLNAAHADGRLANEEYHQRLDRLYAGRTRGDLERLAKDLGGRDAVVEARSSELVVPERVGPQIAVLSKTMARPTGRVDGRLSAVSVLGDVQVDLSYATIGPEGVLIRAYAVAGRSISPSRPTHG